MSSSFMSVYACCCCTVFLLPKPYAPYSLKGSGNTRRAPPFSFLIFLFSLSLFVTPQQINSLLILISQEITYLLSLTPLSSCLHTQNTLASFFTLLLSLCFFLSLSTCMPTHTSTRTSTYTLRHIYKHLWANECTNLPSGDSLHCTLMRTH